MSPHFFPAMTPRFHPAVAFLWLWITVVTSSAQPGTTLIPLPAGGRLATEFMADFPREGLQLYVLETAPPAPPTKVFCLAWDPTAPTVAFKPVLASTPRTPTQFAEQEPGKVFAALNAGYFGGNQSFSLVQHAGVVASPNVKSLSRTFQGASVPYFPTRAAFGITGSGRPTTDWIYSVGTGNTPLIAYPAPSPNRLGVAPQPVPTTASPTGGVPWIMEHAIGGSPMLIKDGEIHVTDAEELIEISDTLHFGETQVLGDKNSTTTVADMLGHRKLRIETRLKLLACWNPAKYGTKVQLGGDPKNPLKVEASVQADSLLEALIKNAELKRQANE
jgi:hypothetical protein